ncbi:hypothetical protein RAS1_36160 [Phycisphaerae bacterium RAS1]|nr:hypothetical protein RAS1_36160 [Phycisphaerae bacterium RAS1]
MTQIMCDVARRITTQQQLAIAADRIAFCYLCGETLPARKPGWKKHLSREHVVPRSILGAGATGAFPIVLWVHRTCDAAKKEQGDYCLTILQRFSVPPYPITRRDVRTMNLRPDLLFTKNDAIPVLTGIGGTIDATWPWVRGLHAVLYAEFLPHDSQRLTFAPVPACSPERREDLERRERFGPLLRQLLRRAMSLNKFDRVRAWGGALRYDCCWVRNLHDCRVLCVWQLETPRVREWSRGVLGAENERPWHGLYFAQSFPPQASVFESEDFVTNSEARRLPWVLQRRTAHRRRRR